MVLVLVLVSYPLAEHYNVGELTEAFQLTLVLLGGLWAVGGRRRTLMWGILMVTPALLGKWVDHWQPGSVPGWAFMLPAVLFVVFVIAHFLLFIMRTHHVNMEVLCAGISGYLLLGLLWTFGYILAAQLSPDAFLFTAGSEQGQQLKGFTALYYSFTTLTTLGYGDIVPVSPLARMLAMMETTVGIFYTTILIARLVTLYSASPQSTGPDEKK